MMSPDEAVEIARVLVGYWDDMKHMPTGTDDRRIIEAVRILLAGNEAVRPRVLTLREVQCYQNLPVIWVEFYGGNGRGEWHNTHDVINFWSQPDSDMYGITLRCWAYKPTREQARSTTWKLKPELGSEKGSSDALEQ